MSDDREGGDKGGKDNLVSFPGGGTPNVTAEGLRKFKADLAIIQEYQQISAQLHWNKYCVLKKQGFSDSQALELCKILP
jgi:hypothetical protein